MTISRTATSRRFAARIQLRTAGVTLGALGLVAGLTACGNDGTQVYERASNVSTDGVAQLQPGSYTLDVTCTDKRSSSRSTTTASGKKKTTSKKVGATPTVSFSTVVDGRQVETDASCTGSDDQAFTLAAPATVTLVASLSGDATYEAKVYRRK